MQPNKKILYGNEARKELKKGIDTVVDAVKITLGPVGRNVALSRPFRSPVITNDGVSIARSIKVKDTFHNMGVEMAKEVAAKTDSVAGDGTTTTLILFQAIIEEGMKRLEKGTNVMKVRKGIEMATRDVINTLKSMAMPVTDYSEIFNVANISVENEEIAKTIADVLQEVGVRGVVVIEESEKVGVIATKTSGYTIDKGFASPYIINNYARLIGEYEDVGVFVTDKRIVFSENLEPMIKSFIENGGKNLIVVASEIEGEALDTFKRSREMGIINIIPVRFPLSESKLEELEDLAIRCNTKIHSDNFLKLTFNDLGNAKKVITRKDSTDLLGCNSQTIARRIEDLDGLLKTDPENKIIAKRLANLQGNVAVIKVGALTETERKYLKLKVDDAVNATKGAMEEGIVDGGGNALRIWLPKDQDPEIQVGYEIIQAALRYPFFQLLKNSGKIKMTTTFWERLKNLFKETEVDEAFRMLKGYNAKTDEFTFDLMEEGIVDPVKVTINALQNASSGASLFLTTEVIVAEEEEVKLPQE